MSIQALLISVAVTLVTVGITFFYFRNRMNKTEQKVDLMFQLIQEHERNSRMSQQMQMQRMHTMTNRNDENLINIADDDKDALPLYSKKALARVWKTERFSWYLTNLTHRFNSDPFEQKMKEAELDYITSSPAGRLMMAENYVGLPL